MKSIILAIIIGIVILVTFIAACVLLYALTKFFYEWGQSVREHKEFERELNRKSSEFEREFSKQKEKIGRWNK